VNPNDWDEIDSVLTRVFGEQRHAPFEPPSHPRIPIGDPSETLVYYTLQRGSPDHRLVCLAVCLASTDGHASWLTTRQAARRTHHLATAVGWNEPTASRIASILEEFVASGLLDRQAVAGEGRGQLTAAAFDGCQPALVIEVAATDGHVTNALATATLERL
jgi:hypothetical protein